MIRRGGGGHEIAGKYCWSFRAEESSILTDEEVRNLRLLRAYAGGAADHQPPHRRHEEDARAAPIQST
jgi:hypothetical protein